MGRMQLLYKREYDYYRLLSADAPVRSPTLYYSDFEDPTHRFVLVLEDIRDGEVVDQLEGASAEKAKIAIRAIARLHGRYWNRVDRPPLSRLHDPTSLKYRLLVQIVYLAHLVPTLRNFGGFFSDEMRRLVEDYGPRIADHIS